MDEKMRQEFEAAVRIKVPILTDEFFARATDGNYRMYEMCFGWDCWQAAVEHTRKALDAG